jgi:hypothetical protein
MNEVIILCSNVFQPLTISISKIKTQLKYENSRIHILTTFESMSKVKKTIADFSSELIENIDYFIYGDLVSEEGNLYHQSEFQASLKLIISKFKNPNSIDFVIASGLNWMSFHLGKILNLKKLHCKVWYVYTLPELEHHSHTPEKEVYFQDKDGNFKLIETINAITSLKEINFQSIECSKSKVDFNLDKKTIIIQCGLEYQPILNTVLKNLELHHEPLQFHLILNITIIEKIKFLLEHHYQEYYNEGTFKFHILEAEKSIENTYYDLTKKIINQCINFNNNLSTEFIIASGRKWMSFLSGYLCSDYSNSIQPSFVWTHPKLHNKNLLTENVNIVSDTGEVIDLDAMNKKDEIIKFKAISILENYISIVVDNDTINFLGEKIKVTNQQAAIFSYLLNEGGKVEMTSSSFMKNFNNFCLTNGNYDKEKTLLSHSYEIANVRSFVSNFNNKVKKKEKEIINQNMCINIIDSNVGCVELQIYTNNRDSLIDFFIKSPNIN